jgi:hypothetical protein
VCAPTTPGVNDVPPALMEATSADSVDAFKPTTTCFRFKSIPCAFEWIKRVRQNDTSGANL